MLSQEERNAIDAFLSHRGINLAAMLRAEKLGYNLDVLRFEIINKLRDSSLNYAQEPPIVFKKNRRDSDFSQL